MEQDAGQADSEARDLSGLPAGGNDIGAKHIAEPPETMHIPGPDQTKIHRGHNKRRGPTKTQRALSNARREQREADRAEGEEG